MECKLKLSCSGLACIVYTSVTIFFQRGGKGLACVQQRIQKMSDKPVVRLIFGYPEEDGVYLVARLVSLH